MRLGGVRRATIAGAMPSASDSTTSSGTKRRRHREQHRHEQHLRRYGEARADVDADFAGSRNADHVQRRDGQRQLACPAAEQGEGERREDEADADDQLGSAFGVRHPLRSAGERRAQTLRFCEAVGRHGLSLHRHEYALG